MKLNFQMELKISAVLRFDNCVAPQFIFHFPPSPKVISLWNICSITAGTSPGQKIVSIPQSSAASRGEEQELPRAGTNKGWGLCWTIPWQRRFNEHIAGISPAPSAQFQNYKLWIRKQQLELTKVRRRERSFSWFLCWICSAPFLVRNRWKSIFLKNYFCVLWQPIKAPGNQPLEVAGGTTNSPSLETPGKIPQMEFQE